MIILQYPNDHLLITTKAVDKITPELVEIAKEMYKVMREANGIGLASTQVGLDVSLLVLEDDGEALIMFNAVILKRSKEQSYDLEGCLSFKDQFRNIKRPVEVTVKFRDIHNKMQYRTLTGIQARALIHEWEHLQGILFITKPEKEKYDQTTS